MGSTRSMFPSEKGGLSNQLEELMAVGDSAVQLKMTCKGPSGVPQ